MDSQLTAGINFRQLSLLGFCISVDIIETHIIITLSSFKTYFIWYLLVEGIKYLFLNITDSWSHLMRLKINSLVQYLTTYLFSLELEFK